MLIRGFHFCLNYCLALIGTLLLVSVIGFLPGLNPGYASLIVLPLLVVSMIEGQSFARLRRVRPRNRQSLVASLQMMVLALVIATIFLIVGKHLMPGFIARMGLPSFDNFGLAISAAVGGTLVVLRTGYAFGLATELKGQQFSG